MMKQRLKLYSSLVILIMIFAISGCGKHNSAYGAYDLHAPVARTTTGLTLPETDAIIALDANKEYIISVNEDYVAIETESADTTKPVNIKTDYDSGLGEPTDIFILNDKSEFFTGFNRYLESGHNQKIKEKNVIDSTSDAHLRDAYDRVKVLYEDNQFPVFKLNNISWLMLPGSGENIFCIFSSNEYAVSGDFAELILLSYYDDKKSDDLKNADIDVDDMLDWYNNTFESNLVFSNNNKIV